MRKSAAVGEIVSLLEKLAPPALAMDWDNVGLLLGRQDKTVKKIVLALDLTEETASQAVSLKADMLITHHPAIFRKIGCLTDAQWQQKLLLTLAENRIALYSAHTNLDCAPGGVNDVLAKRLGLRDLEVLDLATGLGRIGTVEPQSLEEFAVFAKKQLEADYLAVASAGRKVRKVAVCGGAGADLIPLALARGADTLVTGDVKYHEAQGAAFSGLNLVDAGHQPTETPVLRELAARLDADLAAADIKLEICVAAQELLLRHV